VSFLAPWFLAAGAVAGALLLALHLIARQRPRAAPFPTARFIPDRQVRAPSRSVWPTDLALLALRLAIVLLIAGALARPVLTKNRQGVARVILVDGSRAVGSPAELFDSARAIASPGDARIVFDSASSHPGSLSAALVAGIRQARALAWTSDSVELVMVSPFVEEEWDAATAGIRALWPAGIRLLRVAPARIAGGGVAARVLRDAPTAADSAWARDSAGALVHWPSAADGVDSSGAVSAGGVTVVAPFGARAIAADSGARVVARWANGAPAAVERALGAGCVRRLGILPPKNGDLELRASYRRLVERLTAPCGIEERFEALDSARLALLAGDRRTRAAAGSVADHPVDSRLAAAMLALAILLAVAELAARRHGAAA
jgi:hypothetical protein